MQEIKTICHSGKKATMTVRVDEHGHAVQDGPQVEIGGNDRYVSVSRAEFKKITRGEGRIDPAQARCRRVLAGLRPAPRGNSNVNSESWHSVGRRGTVGVRGRRKYLHSLGRRIHAAHTPQTHSAPPSTLVGGQ